MFLLGLVIGGVVGLLVFALIKANDYPYGDGHP